MAFSVLGIGAFVVVSLVIGCRLLILSRHSVQVPALAIGLTFVLTGGVGFPLLFSTVIATDLLGDALAGVHVAGLLSVNAGAVALWIFTWRTFRPDAAWAGPLVAVASVCMAASILGQAATDGFARPVGPGTWYWVGFAGRALALVWTGSESLLYFTQMRRRVELGLAEPLLANRFLLWGVSSWAAVSTSALSAGTILASAENIHLIATMRGAGALFGLVAAGAQWLAFFPPNAYRRWWSDVRGSGPAS